MDTKQIRYFLALAQERNFTRAALRLHMAQPPLTRHIRALEEELGTPLFIRTPKGVDLTEAGQALAEDLPKVLALTQRSRERALRVAQGLVGQLDVGLFGSGVLDVIPRLLARFHALRPEVRINLHNLSKSAQIQALREGRIHVGFNRLVPPEDDLVVETVLREKLVVALPAQHALATRSQLCLQDLADQPLILYPNLPVPGLAQQVLEAFHREGVQVRVEQAVDEVLTAIALVASGFGVCITAGSSTALRLPGVVYVPLVSEPLRDIELSCLYLRSNASAVLKTFLEVVRGFDAHMPEEATA